MARQGRARSGLIGLCWGAGHATTVLALGVPVLLWAAVLPQSAQRAVEALIGLVIFALGVRLLVRHGRGELHAHPHESPATLREAYAVGVVHGAGGSAGIGLLLIASSGGCFICAFGAWYLAAAAVGAPYPF